MTPVNVVHALRAVDGKHQTMTMRCGLVVTHKGAEWSAWDSQVTCPECKPKPPNPKEKPCTVSTS